MEYKLYTSIINSLSSEKSLPLKIPLPLKDYEKHSQEDLLEQLINMGCVIKDSHSDKLKLSKHIELYNSADIILGCTQDPLMLSLFVQIDSTNTYLKSQPHVNEKLHVCLTEQQTKGRGRRGKAWVSTFAENIYMSLRKRINVAPMVAGGLSLVVGLAVIKTVEQLSGAKLQIKWPNDVYFQGEKLAGVLIEVVAIKPNSIEVVVGVGLNVNMSSTSSCDIDQQWTDLFRIFQDVESSAILPSRNIIVASLINHICDNLNTFEKEGMDVFLSEWYDHDLLLGKCITILSGTKKRFGEAIGINCEGKLLVRNETGVTEIDSGEVSVRLMPSKEQ